MEKTDLTQFDIKPEAMVNYLRYNGPHFNKKLLDFATSKMEDKNGKLTPYTKEQVDDLLETYDIKLKRNKLYDACYVANMCQADFLGKSVPTEEHLCKYVRDVLDDADAEEGYVFNRFYADTIFMNNPIEWDDMV